MGATTWAIRADRDAHIATGYRLGDREDTGVVYRVWN